MAELFPHAASQDCASPGLRIGIDLVQVGAVGRSVAEFGVRFTQRLFADGELRDASVDGRLDIGALALRFAAKEATIKAFDLSEAGIGWRQIEVTQCDGAVGRVRLHDRAASLAVGGAHEIAVALARVDDLACAIVVAVPVAAHHAGPAVVHEGEGAPEEDPVPRGARSHEGIAPDHEQRYPTSA